MWQCSKCRENVDDEFDVCWNCGTSADGVEDPGFRKADEMSIADTNLDDAEPAFEESSAIREDAAPSIPVRTQPSPLLCLRCDRAIEYLGTKSFHEGFQWGGLLGDLGEFFVNRENFDLYVCRRCGRVEFFISGIGEQFRPRKAKE